MSGITGISGNWTFGQREESAPAPRVGPGPLPDRAATVASLPETEDIPEESFDFDAARSAAEATLRRDSYQMMLAGLADGELPASAHQAGGTMRQQDVEAAYREFEF
jgi:hypothetical protein